MDNLEMNMLAPDQLIHLQRVLGNAGFTELLRRSGRVDPSAQRVIETSQPGEVLDPAVRAEMESHFGHDFSRVRVHHDATAAEAANAVNARAFTIGSDIVFNHGEYVPHSPMGRGLVAHELAHIVEQHKGVGIAGPIVQRQPLPSRPKSGREIHHGDYSFFSINKGGITIKVGVLTTDEKAIRSRIPTIISEITAANSAIKESVLQVRLCIIAPTTSRFALYQGKPILLLDTEATPATAAHEMSHAIFHAFTHKDSKAHGPAPSAPAETAIRISDIFLRLGQTKEETRNVPTILGGLEKPHPVGLWMVDPTSWAGSKKPEHPWDSPDEFFASAREAIRINPRGLHQAIKRASAADPKVIAPAEDLLKLLAGIPTSQLPSTRQAPAIAKLGHESEPGKLEDTLDSMVNTVLRWALDPSIFEGTTVP